MESVSSEGAEKEAHPPVTHHARPSDETSPRPTIRTRPMIEPRIWRGHPGFSLTSLYVRRYWTAVIGPGAVCDLMRLARAGERRTRIQLPLHVPRLLELGLAYRDGSGRIAVPDRLPRVPPSLIRRCPLPLQREHKAFLRQLQLQQSASARDSG